MKKALLCITAGVLVTASAAFAANREGQMSVSPYIGGYSFEGDGRLDTSLAYGVKAGYNITERFGAEAVFDSTRAKTSRYEKNYSLYRYGGELLYHFFPKNDLVPYLAAGFNGLNFDANGSDGKVRGAFDYGVGAKYFLNDSFALRGDVRHIIYRVNDWTNSNLEYTIGAYIPFGGTKAAPKPAAAPLPVPKAVEPPPAPKAVEPPPVPAPAKVEPPPTPPRTVEPPPAPAVPEASLTVVPATLDRGQQAVLSWKSKHASDCNIQPGIGPVPPQGARPVTPGDSTAYSITCNGSGGIATAATSVTVSTRVPPIIPVLPKPAVQAVAEKFCSKPAIINIQFDTGKADIKPQYAAELKNLAEFLKEFPRATGEISGHTDNVGGKEMNRKLSQQRAESVKKYIVDTFGIASERISAKGYGYTKPLADNKTAAGKNKNRRIEASFTCN